MKTLPPALGVLGGLALLVAATVIGVFPLLPAATRGGRMQGVPHAPVGALALGAAGLVLLLWTRHRAG
ncbi:MAG: hypothetical protein ACRD1E_06240 [Terriglobales bacterium]